MTIFLGVALLCALEPGPNFVHLSVQSMRNGRRHAIWTALGMHVGAYPYVIATAIGLASLLAAMPTVLTALKWMAGGYLIWLGIQAFRGRKELADAAGSGSETSRGKAVSAFAKGLLLVLGNPRTPLFYATFPLLFVSADLSVPPALQLLVIAALTNMVFLCVDIAFVCTLETMQLRNRLPGFDRLFRWVGGGLLVGFGLRQLLARN
jgi:threonine/homoserine/homoserine lactone efflux protein